jgi:antitoxin component of MazEF toxin-antitoxin module
MKTLTKTRAIGGSLVVTIPIEIVKEENIKEGELVEIEIEKIKKSGFGILKEIERFTEKERKEMWRERI